MERERPREIVIRKKVKHGGYSNIERQSFAERFKEYFSGHFKRSVQSKMEWVSDLGLTFQFYRL